MEETGLIDWTSDDTQVLLNPRLPRDEQERLTRLAKSIELRAHVWIATSGSTAAFKLVALSKHALLASAAAVNRHLQAGADDVWACVLPTFHVGGLGIYARAHLSAARVDASTWDPLKFAHTRATLASLVPAQVSDLVQQRHKCPPSLRAIVVGGGQLDPDLYERGRKLGWPLMPSYGMTECCSQIATATIQSPELVLLDHFEARRENDGRLAFRGESLLTGWIVGDRFEDPRIDGWFVSDDLGTVEGHKLRIEGRRGEFVKIGGESVDLGRLDAILESIRGTAEAALVAVPDSRLGFVIHLAATTAAEVVVKAFNERVMPFERIRSVHQVASIPRTPLGKLLRAQLVDAILSLE